MQIRWSGVAAGAFLLAGATACANAVNSVPQPRTPAATPQLAFVVNATVSPPVLGEYPVGATTPVRTIDQPAGTFGMRIDASGTLYRVVATGASYEVQEIAAGTTQPARTISLGSNQPYGMEFDGSGALWIASAQGTLAKYPLAATSPSLVIHPRGCANPQANPRKTFQFAVDSFGTAYVICGAFLSAERQRITEYDDSSKVARTIDVPVTDTTLNPVTDSTGRLYVNYSTKGAPNFGIIEYERGQTVPLRSFTLPYSGAGPLSYDAATGQIVESFGLCYSINGSPWRCDSRIAFIDRDATVPAYAIVPGKQTLLGFPYFDSIGNVYAGSAKLTTLSRNPSLQIRRYSPGSRTHFGTLFRGRYGLVAVWPFAGSVTTDLDQKASQTACAFRTRGPNVKVVAPACAYY